MTTGPSPTETLRDSPAALVFERNRTKYNSWFAAASRAGCTIDPTEFTAYLLGPVRLVAEAVHTHEPARLETVIDVLFSVSLELFSKAQLGGPRARTPRLADLWSRLLTMVPRQVAESPRAVVAGLSNALVNISTDAPATGERWLEELRNVAPTCGTAADLVRAGTVLAWRCGLPHYRASALEVWRTLPDPVRRQTLGADAHLPMSEIEAGLGDPWWRPGLSTGQTRQLTLVGIAGDFRGLGGPFVEPPLVTADAETIYAYDSIGCCCLHADTFGTSLRLLREAPTGQTGAGTPEFTIDSRGHVACGPLRADLPQLAGSLSSAALPHLLAVTLRSSHRVYLVAPVWNRA
jgi:hypothetical protein